MPQTLWVISDGKPGHLNQSLAIAHELGREPQLFTLTYGKEPRFYFLLALALLSRIPLLGKVLAKLALPAALKNLSPAPSQPPENTVLCFATGTLPLPILVLLRQAWGIDTLAVMARRPFSFNAFTLCVRHQLGDAASHPQQVLVLGAPAKAKDPLHQPAFYDDLLPKTQNQDTAAVLIGGPVPWQGDALQPFSNLLNSLQQLPTPFFLTTSRRTPQELEAPILAFPPNQCPFHLIARTQPGNPIPAFLKLSKVAIVTGESISMVSEALSAGLPVIVVKVWDAPPKGRGRKFVTFLEHLEKEGWIRLVEPLQIPQALQDILASPAPRPFPNGAVQVAEELRKRGLF